MPIILHNASIQCLVAVRGHPFDRTRFDALFQSMDGISATLVDQPAAARLMNRRGMSGFDVLVLYDMPGLDFTAPVGRPTYLEPGDALKSGFRELLQDGIGILALHHALAGWPAWPEYAGWLGGSFLYHPGKVRGASRPDSGYVQDTTYAAQVLAEHPVTAGVPQTFEITDELYLAEVFEDDVTPLLRSGFEFKRERFWSADAAVAGRMNSREGWDHAPGSNLIGWTRQAIESTVVYLQPGDGPSAYDNPHYRRLVENSIRWLAKK